MIEPVGETVHDKPLCSEGQFALGPPHGFGDRHSGNAFFLGFVECGVGAHGFIERDIGSVAPGQEISGGDGQQQDDEERDAQLLEYAHASANKRTAASRQWVSGCDST